MYRVIHLAVIAQISTKMGVKVNNLPLNDNQFFSKHFSSLIRKKPIQIKKLIIFFGIQRFITK